MENFTINGLAQELEQLKDTAEDPQAAITQALKDAIATHGAQTIIDALEAAIPEGASVGELIVHRSSKLTFLYGRIPPHFRSAIHDHTVFACIAQLTGAETSVVYEPTADGKLRVVETKKGLPGEVTTLAPDAIHHIENPTDDIAAALHVYGGDFSAVEEARSLWSHEEHVRGSFSFPQLMKESVIAMKKTGNEAGLQGVAENFPAARPMIEAL